MWVKPSSRYTAAAVLFIDAIIQRIANAKPVFRFRRTEETTVRECRVSE